MASLDPTLPVVKNILLLDSEGKRIAVQYFTEQYVALWHKTRMPANADMLLSTPLHPQVDSGAAVELREVSVEQDQPDKCTGGRCVQQPSAASSASQMMF